MVEMGILFWGKRRGDQSDLGCGEVLARVQVVFDLTGRCGFGPCCAFERAVCKRAADVCSLTVGASESERAAAWLWCCARGGSDGGCLCARVLVTVEQHAALRVAVSRDCAPLRRNAAHDVGFFVFTSSPNLARFASSLSVTRVSVSSSSASSAMSSAYARMTGPASRVWLFKDGKSLSVSRIAMSIMTLKMVGEIMQP